jgi:hypothetical protein
MLVIYHLQAQINFKDAGVAISIFIRTLLLYSREVVSKKEQRSTSGPLLLNCIKTWDEN